MEDRISSVTFVDGVDGVAWLDLDVGVCQDELTRAWIQSEAVDSVASGVDELSC